jgi:hypothetical protein
MSFWAFVLLSARYGNKIGLLAAGIFALLPSTITKMFAGVSEVQSYGLFAMLFLFGAYLLAIRKNDLKIAALAGFAYGVVLIGSQVDIVPNLVIGVFVLAEGIRKYFEKENMDDFLAINAVMFAGAALSIIVHALYTQSLGLGTLLSPSLLFIGGGLALGALLYRAGDIVSRALPHLPAEKRVKYEQYFVLGIFIVLAVVFFLTPVGEKAHNYAESAVSAASYPVALFRTISEQGQAGTSFEGTTGFIGFNFKSPDSVVYGVFNIFTSIFNFLVHGADMLIGWLFGIDIATSEKANSLMLFFFLFAAISLSVSYLARFLPKKHGEEGHARDLASTSLFFLLLIFPVAYVGLNKLKYEVFLGIVAAVAACVVFGEAEKFVHWLIGKVKYKGEHEAERKNYQKMLAVGMWGLVLLTIFFQYNSTDLLPDVGSEEFTIAKALFTTSFSPRYQDDPVKMAPRMKMMCEDIQKAGQYSPEVCGAGNNESYSDLVDAQYNSNLCIISQFSSIEELSRQNQLKIAGAQLRCGRLANYWLDSMEWISKNTPNGSRVISWWDYGHWINYFGERNAVLRNEHSSSKMIQQVAYAYTRGSTEDLIRDMKYFDSKYALFDMELLMSGGGLGGKFGALNYLGCVYANQTDVSHSPSTSRCESENMFESVYAPHTTDGTPSCTISQSQGIEGFVVGGSSAKKLPNGNWGIIAEPRYCGTMRNIPGVGDVLQLYYLDKKDGAGDLILNRGIPRYSGSDGNIDVYSVLYTKDKIWADANGLPTDGWDDRQGSFYNSNLYRAFVLRELPGFREVYETSGGEVKIFELIE